MKISPPCILLLVSCVSFTYYIIPWNVSVTISKSKHFWSNFSFNSSLPAAAARYWWAPTEDEVKQKSKDFNSEGFWLEPCNCTKYKHRQKSTTSEEATWYGAEQNVVSYCLHENIGKLRDDGDKFEVFRKGVQPNVDQVLKLYPGWIMRIYSDHDLDEEFCPFACLDNVMWCDVRHPNLNHLEQLNYRMWRFMPFGDPTVSKFVSRDMDSYVCEREREAVADWEKSSKIFHLTRDSPTHHPRSILAGMWGAKNYLLSENETSRINSAFWKQGVNDTRFETDEQLLDRLIFKKYPKDILAHDSYTCKRYKVLSVPFPKQRRDRYTRVALGIRVMKDFLAPPCPQDCRPSYGKNWTYC